MEWEIVAAYKSIQNLEVQLRKQTAAAAKL